MDTTRRCEGRRFSDEERMLMYRRVLEGCSYLDIAAEFDSSLNAIYRVFGARRDRSVVRRRSALRLSLEEREEISRGISQGSSVRAIASSLGRAPSSVSREINRNGGPERYRAWRGDVRAIRMIARSRVPKLARNKALRSEVERLLSKL